jgi:hypothetical protein
MPGGRGRAPGLKEKVFSFQPRADRTMLGGADWILDTE